MIANVSPSVVCYEETLNTLKYASRAKSIQKKVVACCGAFRVKSVSPSVVLADSGRGCTGPSQHFHSGVTYLSVQADYRVLAKRDI